MAVKIMISLPESWNKPPFWISFMIREEERRLLPLTNTDGWTQVYDFYQEAPRSPEVAFYELAVMEE